MTSIKYPDQIQQKISLLEAANGAGLFIGPLLGGLIYQFTSFWTPFFLFTALSFVMIPFMLKKFTAELDQDDSANQTGERIGYLKLLKDKRVTFAALAQFFNILMFTVGQPVFGPRLIHDYGLSSFWVGACFALPTIFYILTGPIFLPLLTKGFEKRATMMVGFFILAVAAFLVGPSRILGFPKESAPLMIIGLGILGTGAAFTVIPVIPEMLDSVKDEYEGQQTELSDNFSAIFNIAGGFGQIIGPSTAGLLNDQVGFNFTFDIIGGMILAFNLIYILACGGFGSLGRSFRARLLTCRKKKEVGSDSPTHHLLNEESETQDELNSSGSDSPKATRKGDEEAPESADISTDTSLVQDTAYAIN
jgi:MFS family permease